MRIFVFFFFTFTFCCITLFSQEEGFEFVNPPMTIVVLGSSTAAGAGTWPIDNAWVNRFRCHVQAFNPENQVINLAKGGYNSYHLLPTGSETFRRSKIDTMRNMTKAMEFNPDGIIINLPSNDVSGGFSVKEQLDNFRTYQNYADSFGVELWITTTQARNFPRKRKRQLQANVKDSLQNLFPRNCIDFWNGFCDEEFRVLKEYDSGDGCHLNNEGHRILTDRVIESQAFCWELNETSFQRSTSIADQEELSPHMMKIGFLGNLEFDLTQADKSRIVKVVQENRVLNAVEVPSTNYDVTTIVDLRLPIQIVYEAPNTLTKIVELDLAESLSFDMEELSDYYYPFESLDMEEIPLDQLTYRFPNNSITVAKFHIDTTEFDLEVKLNKSFAFQQKQRVEDAKIIPPSKGNKLKTYWDNGKKKSVLKFKKGQLNGKSKWFSENGTKKRVSTFKNGAYFGKHIDYDPFGKREIKRKFEDDKQVGEAKIYN